MKHVIYGICYLLCLTFVCCTNTLYGQSSPDSIVLTESYDISDYPVNEYMTGTLAPIRENYKRINTITNWTTVIIRDINGTSEGGVALFYYMDKKLEKILTKHFGETFQILTEYYFLNDKLSFVVEQSYNYNRPIYYDSIAMVENNDNEIFDFDKSEIMENKSYFVKDELIHQSNNQDCGSPFASDYLKSEELRIKRNYQKVIAVKEQE